MFSTKLKSINCWLIAVRQSGATNFTGQSLCLGCLCQVFRVKESLDCVRSLVRLFTVSSCSAKTAKHLPCTIGICYVYRGDTFRQLAWVRFAMPSPAMAISVGKESTIDRHCQTHAIDSVSSLLISGVSFVCMNGVFPPARCENENKTKGGGGQGNTLTRN